MIADQPLKLLIAKVGNEFGAHQVYLGISIYFTRQSLSGWAKLFHDQSVEEAQHGSKMATRERWPSCPLLGHGRATWPHSWSPVA